jgi:hypothetical protein
MTNLTNTTSDNATTTETTKSSNKINRKAATAALSSLTKAKNVLEGHVSIKKVEKRKAIEARKSEGLQAALLVLNTGTTKKWSARFALVRAVTAMKLGATAEDLRACKALMEVADWFALETPVREYAAIVKADPDKVAGALCTKKVESVSVVEPASAHVVAESVKPPTPIRTMKPTMPAVKPIATKPVSSVAKPVSRVSKAS